MLHCVIMAGGSGTRFWPLSRKQSPKQLLKLAGNRSLLQQTVDRVSGLVPPENIWIVTGEHLVEPILEQLPELSAEQLIVEPCGRNTAPCIGLAAIKLLALDAEAEMLVLPSDHVIETTQQFHTAIKQGQQLLKEEASRFILYGAKPSFPSTGFGYIERETNCLAELETGYEVAAFHEKPNLPTAEKYLETGQFYWNCGIFLWRAEQILNALQSYQADLYEHLQNLQTALGKEDWQARLEFEFPRMPSISIDYAVLEKAENVCVIEAGFEWDDLGSWQALKRLLPEDAKGNIVSAQHVGKTENSIIYSAQNEHLIATIGLKDCLVVQTEGVTLVAQTDDEHALKELLEEIKQRQDYDRYL